MTDHHIAGPISNCLKTYLKARFTMQRNRQDAGTRCLTRLSGLLQASTCRSARPWWR